MTTKAEAPVLSREFQRLYCDAAVFEGYSSLYPVSLRRVLPFQAHDLVVDDASLLAVEAAHLANPNDENRLAKVNAFGRCGLLSAVDVANLRDVIDDYDASFFELMGEVYANAGMYICALRWHREFIAELELNRPDTASDSESVYASVGYCLYSLGLFPEAVAWSKCCIGPGQTIDTVRRALINYEAQEDAGCIVGIERATNRTRYTVSTFDPAKPARIMPRLKAAVNGFAPHQEAYIDWIGAGGAVPPIQPEGYPFQAERDAGAMPRHRMNLIFSLYGQADELADRGYTTEAKRLLHEASLLEPQAGFIQYRLKYLP